MTQRQLRTTSTGLHLDSLICEKYMNKLVNHEKQLNQMSAALKGREKMKSSINEHRNIKPRPNVRQQNILPAPRKNTIQYADDSVLVDMEVKKNRRPKTSVDRECWDQMLKEHKSGDKVSVFGNFDPLRTLHFLSRELQIQLQTILPDDYKIQQLVSDMQYALKRVPPEVASQVHLLQGLEILQGKSKIDSDKKLYEEKETLNRAVQTENIKTYEDSEKLHKIMTEGTLKLEWSCRQMEKLCTDLKTEKNEMEDRLIDTKKEIKMLKNKINELEHENSMVLNPRIVLLEEEKRKLSNQLKTLTTKFGNESEHTINNFKSQIAELRSQKNALEQECNKAKYQIKVSALEREKFMAILTLRDTQINEIKIEMGQLQEMVNEQLLDMHTNAFQCAPYSENTNNNQNCPDGNAEKLENQDEKKLNNLFDDNTISTILTNGEISETPMKNISCYSFNELQTGEIDLTNKSDLEYIIQSLQSQDKKIKEQIPLTENLNSHTSLKTMFDEVTKTAYAVARSQKNDNHN